MLNLEQLAVDYNQQEPTDIIRLALEKFSTTAISFSGAEDVVLIDMAIRIDPEISVFCLDTGRLHSETYKFIEQVRQHYKIVIDVLSPDSAALQKMVKEKGLFSFYQDGHHECCDIRKVLPLKRKLATLTAWITGQRKDQSPDTRATIPVLEQDSVFSSTTHRLIKFNPLANWSSAKVWEYIRQNDVPYNPLHARGYRSIGCEPCTRVIIPNQHEREGRWWWEEETQKECGLHVKITGTSNNQRLNITSAS